MQYAYLTAAHRVPVFVNGTTSAVVGDIQVRLDWLEGHTAAELAHIGIVRAEVPDPEIAARTAVDQEAGMAEPPPLS